MSTTDEDSYYDDDRTASEQPPPSLTHSATPDVQDFPPPRQASDEETSQEDAENDNTLDVSELLAYIDELEEGLPDDGTHFGHPVPPTIHMCRLWTRGPSLVAVMAVSERCISLQLIQEVQDGPNKLGTPVEVLVMKGSDQISCASLMALELPWLSAPDRLLIEDEHPEEEDIHGTSLMVGGVVPIAPSPRLAVVLGTEQSRVLSVEFTVKPKALQLIRRNTYNSQDVVTFYEPLPFGMLSNYQRSHRHGEPGPNGEKPRRIVPFEPREGVCSMVPYTVFGGRRPATYLWIAYGDGTAVRVHHAAMFASVVQKHNETQPNPESLEDLLAPIVRWEARLPPLEATNFTLIPIPKYHPSPLAPFPAWKKPEFDDHPMPDFDDDGNPTQFENYEAVVYCSGAMADSFPTIAFYTSEDQIEGRRPDPLEEEEEEAKSKGVISSVIGGLFGMIVGSAPVAEQEEKVQEPVVAKTSVAAQWDADVPLPSLNFDPLKLYAGSEFHDPPRRVTQCTVEPEGDLAAMTDTLGRVSLIDLNTKQIIRMWKGLRDTTCSWLEIPRKTPVKPGQKRKVLYLVIHSRQRKVVEVWRTRHGPKVLSMQVHREAQVVTVRELSPLGYLSSCYLAHSPGVYSKMNHLERIIVEEDESAGTITADRNRQPQPNLTLAPTEAAARLNRLKQLLSDTNIGCQSVDVFKALERITSLEDMASALDTLAAAPSLERKMGVDGSTFQKLAISCCKQRLDEAFAAAGEEAFSNPHVQLLAFKIAYYNQVAKAYDVLHKHETQHEVEEPPAGASSPTQWGIEAVGWTHVYETVNKTNIDSGLPGETKDPMKFYEFTSALQQPKKHMEEDYVVENGGYTIYFSDSTRTRREILVRIFKPLLGDVFSFSAVSQIFDALGTKNDDEYVMKCFGEWFSTLSVKEVVKKTVFSEESPVRRWLEDRITEQLNENPDVGEFIMESIYQYCRKSEELVRAFWLAALCHEAMNEVGAELEEKTYGKISQATLVYRWNLLLRQLRVCLLVSLRLHGIQLGAEPISVHGVDKANDFSPYQWLAHDELSMSNAHDEILSLERACRMSNRSFDASSEFADDPHHVKTLQKSCLTSALSDEERAEYLVDVDDDERLGALLLYLPHFNRGDILVAHRALLLAGKWGRKPQQLDILRDAMVALRKIDVNEHQVIASAVRLEIWQSRVRPMYRALLFGVADVQEVSPEAVVPLFQDVAWVKQFSDITSSILYMLNKFEWEDQSSINKPEHYINDVEDHVWPVPMECPILDKLIARNKMIKETAYEAHQMLMTALKVTQDFRKLSRCIPSFYELFTPPALFQEAVPLADAEENQQALMQDAVVAYARNYNGPSLEALQLGELEVLSDLFEFEMDNIRTLFLLAMYEYGKDRLVDDIITRNAPAINVEYFCAGGVELLCRRLDHALHVEPSEDIRSIMGTLDPNLCEWIRDKADTAGSLVDNPDLSVPPGNTHLFALRLLSLGASADIGKKERIEIHSLIVLSGQIIKGMEGLHPEPVMGLSSPLLQPKEGLSFEVMPPTMPNYSRDDDEKVAYFGDEMDSDVEPPEEHTSLHDDDDSLEPPPAANEPEVETAGETPEEADQPEDDDIADVGGVDTLESFESPDFNANSSSDEHSDDLQIFDESTDSYGYDKRDYYDYQ
eukprot:Nitzschia sp. Nitz4//scaffold70_size99833//14390//19422//NITZ4_004586-RA/size99833-snap-gene-0.126-mRNA-1//1//CDS//3329557108//9183//frame0